jgi:hypothetical protein
MRMPHDEATPQCAARVGGETPARVFPWRYAGGHTLWPTLCSVDETLTGQLKAASARRQRLTRQLEQARAAERALIFEVLEAKELRQSAIVAITGYTREHVFRLDTAESKARGLPPRPQRPGYGLPADDSAADSA